MESVPATPEPQVFEILDAPELAARMKLPLSWIREQCRSRISDKIPHLAFGRYKRFEFGSPDLTAWIERRRVKRDGAPHPPRRLPHKTEKQRRTDSVEERNQMSLSDTLSLALVEIEEEESEPAYAGKDVQALISRCKGGITKLQEFLDRPVSMHDCDVTDEVEEDAD